MLGRGDADTPRLERDPLLPPQIEARLLEAGQTRLKVNAAAGLLPRRIAFLLLFVLVEAAPLLLVLLPFLLLHHHVLLEAGAVLASLVLVLEGVLELLGAAAPLLLEAWRN